MTAKLDNCTLGLLVDAAKHQTWKMITVFSLVACNTLKQLFAVGTHQVAQDVVAMAWMRSTGKSATAMVVALSESSEQC